VPHTRKSKRKVAKSNEIGMIWYERRINE
jgi:hypothetical protein